ANSRGIVRKHGVDHGLPGITQHNAADKVRHKEDCAEKVGTAEFAGQQPRQEEDEDVDCDHGDDDHEDGETEGGDETITLGESFDVVVYDNTTGLVDRDQLNKGNE